MTKPTTELPESVPTFVGTATVSGREMSVKTLTDAQFMTLTHEATLLQSPNVPSDRKIKAVDRVFRVLKSIIVEDADIEFIQDEMAEGNLEMRTLAQALLTVHHQAKSAGGVPTKGPVKAARRGRASQS